jgi:hypothetical protein
MSRARDLAGIFNLNPLSGTTAQRPAAAEVGEIYYNGTTGKTQIYTPTGWQDMASGIPYGNTAGRPAAVTGQPYFNGEVGRLELYTADTGWQNIIQEVPGVSSIVGSYSEATNSGSITITGTNFSPGAITSAIGTNGVEVQATSTTYNSLVQLTATFTNLSNTNEPYDIKVTNPSNLFGMLPDALYINASPVWVTSSGSLGTFYEQVSISVSATATDSDSTVSYALASGSTLPAGISLNSSSGLISGTLPSISSQTTYTFTVNATDGLNTIPRSFSILANPAAVVSGGTLISTDPTYFYRIFTSGTNNLNINDSSLAIELALIGGGGGGGLNGAGSGWGCGGGAGGLLKTNSAITLNPGSYPITVGAAGALAPAGGSAGFGGGDGGNTVFNTSFIAYGGGGGANAGGAASRVGNGGSGGGGYDRAGSSIQNSPSGWTGYGFAGGGNNTSSAGGGGAGGVGDNGGPGGIGSNAISSWISAISSSMPGSWQTATASGYIAGGGAGFGGGAKSGGTGGGGNSGAGTGSSGIDGTGGGGGGTDGTNYGTSGLGGSGLAIVRYLKSSAVING